MLLDIWDKDRNEIRNKPNNLPFDITISIELCFMSITIQDKTGTLFKLFVPKFAG
jgi:hypothetical protein